MHHISGQAKMLASVFDRLLARNTSKAWAASLRLEFDDLSSEDEQSTVGGWLHVACYAPTHHVRVFASFSEQRLEPFAAAASHLAIAWQPIACHESDWSDAVEFVVNDVFEQVQCVAVERLKRQPGELSVNIALDCLKQSDGPSLLGPALEFSQWQGEINLTMPADVSTKS